MKTKLLKKVRRRYSIEKCTKADAVGSFMWEIAQEIGLPFYYAHDNKSMYFITPHSKNKKAVFDWLILRIKKDYQHTQKKELTKTETVWP